MTLFKVELVVSDEVAQIQGVRLKCEGFPLCESLLTHGCQGNARGCPKGDI